MRLRFQLMLLAAASVLPFLVALPWALRETQRAYERELDVRLEGARRASQAAIADVSVQVERAVRELAMAPEVEEIARTLHAGADRADLVPLGERLMTLSGLGALVLLDGEGRTLTSGHLPARAGDPDPESLGLARDHPGKAIAARVELRSAHGISSALAVLAGRPVDYGTSRIYVVGGRLLSEGWARRLSELTGAEVAVSLGGREIVRTAQVSHPRAGVLPVGDPERPLGTVRVELSSAPLAEAQAKAVRGAVLLWLALLAVALASSLLTARRIARPVDALARGARSIAAGRLGEEVKVAASGELGELVAAFNAMSAGLKSATERAAVAERVAAWQGVARRLAHEIKNPLTPIRMSVETLLAAHRARRPDFDEIFKESAQAVLEEVERLRRIVDEFSRFARLPKPQLAPVDLSELATSVLTLYAAPPEGIRIERELAAGLRVSADRDQLTQVLINLVTNAEQAMERGGRIAVRALALESGEAALEVEDEGPGIKPEDRAHIFEPYFTTKTGGTGLGLAIALRIAQEHGGRLEELGGLKGARFRLTLPRAADAGQPQTGAVQAAGS